MEKMTYVNALNIALDNLTTLDVDIEVIEKLEALRDKYAKPKSKSDKPTKTQIENAELAEKVADWMRGKDWMRAKEIAEGCELSSTSKASSILKILVESGRVEKSEEPMKFEGVKSKATGFRAIE